MSTRSRRSSQSRNNLLTDAYKNAVQSRCATRRVTSRVQQKEKAEGIEQVACARECVVRVENELQKIRGDILPLGHERAVRPGRDWEESGGEHPTEVAQLAHHAGSGMHAHSDDPFAKIKRSDIHTFGRAKAAELRCELINVLSDESERVMTVRPPYTSESLEAEKIKIGELSGERGSKRSELNGSRPGRSNDELTETTELVLEIACPCTSRCFWTARANLYRRNRTDQSELPSRTR